MRYWRDSRQGPLPLVTERHRRFHPPPNPLPPAGGGKKAASSCLSRQFLPLSPFLPHPLAGEARAKRAERVGAKRQGGSKASGEGGRKASGEDREEARRPLETEAPTAVRTLNARGPRSVVDRACSTTAKQSNQRRNRPLAQASSQSSGRTPFPSATPYRALHSGFRVSSSKPDRGSRRPYSRGPFPRRKERPRPCQARVQHHSRLEQRRLREHRWRA